MKKKTRENLCISERRAIRLPQTLFEDGPFVELRGQREVCIQGAKKILFCHDEEVRIKLNGTALIVRGNHLYCETYYAGAISIKGKIYSLSFDGADCSRGVQA